jgi:hypothetical protein
VNEQAGEPVLVTPATVQGGVLESAAFLDGLTDAVHRALLAAAEGWAVTQEGGPGEEERPWRYADPAASSVAATVAATAAVEHLLGLFSAGPTSHPTW